jgi:hypothetical protein
LSKNTAGSGLDRRAAAQGVGDMEHKVQSAPQELRQGPESPCEAKGVEPPHPEGTAVGDHFLVRAVGALTGRACGIEVVPRWSAALDRPHETRRGFACHAVAGAPDTGVVGAVPLFRGRTEPATAVLSRVGVVVVAMGATEAAARRIGCAGWIIAPFAAGFR